MLPMSQEEIQQILDELEALRKENQDLRISGGLPSPELVNGYPAPARIKEDVILKGLRTQVSVLQQANKDMKQAMETYDNAERTLATLLPALEVQLKGQTTEIHNLKLNIEQTEHTFAGVVHKLEQQVKQMRKMHRAEKRDMQKQFEQELFRIQTEYETLQAERASQLSRSVDSPFKDLSIFEFEQ